MIKRLSLKQSIELSHLFIYQSWVHSFLGKSWVPRYFKYKETTQYGLTENSATGETANSEIWKEKLNEGSYAVWTPSFCWGKKMPMKKMPCLPWMKYFLPPKLVDRKQEEKWPTNGNETAKLYVSKWNRKSNTWKTSWQSEKNGE